MAVIRLSSIPNLRDLGGLVNCQGRAIRPNCLLRSAHLGNAEPEEVSVLKKEHRLDTVIDLRTALEREQCPDRRGDIPELWLPLLTEEEAGFTREKRKLEDTPIPDMPALYGWIVRDGAVIGRLRAILRSIMTHDFTKGSVLWHCSEGKDRCGIVSALILEILSVDRGVIMADFLETNVVNLPKAEKIYRELLPTYGERIAQGIYDTYVAKEEYLLTAWKAMGDDYPTRVLGFSEREMEAFRRAVLES